MDSSKESFRRAVEYLTESNFEVFGEYKKEIKILLDLSMEVDKNTQLL
ncbi:hypothetical protein [Helicobacter cetorum]|nr:hypothetical protein [Helicobacter cetorum]